MENLLTSQTSIYEKYFTKLTAEKFCLCNKEASNSTLFVNSISFLFACTFFRELEAKANMTQPSINSLPLGNSVYLSLDAAPESIKIYQDLAKSYQWYDKTREYATGASNLVSQNSLSRSYGKMTKSRRRAPNTSHIASPK